MAVWKSIGIVAVVFTLGVQHSFSPAFAAEDKNLEQMITTAKTPADHQAIADFYRNEGVAFQKEADQHAQLAQKLAGEAGGQAPWASHHYERAEHCRKLADSLGQAAQEAQALAKIHEGMAQSSTEEKQ
jgi:hypothetical protein